MYAHAESYGTVEDYSAWLSGNSSTYKRNVKKLDDESVEEFAIPVLFGISLSDMTPNFGDPRGAGTRLHDGLDLIAPEGVPIVTPTDAVVLKTGNGPSSGKVVYTTNPGGETFVYMHLESIADIKSGQLLKEGDLIGTVGDTGNAVGTPHLHLEVRKGKALDPFPRITKEFTLKEKMGFLARAFDTVDDEKALAEFLVGQYRGIFILAEAQGIQIPDEIKTKLKRSDVVSLDGVPIGLALGDEGDDVVALQTALIASNIGPQATRLGNAGATGYFGSLTQSALIEYQTAFGLSADGILTAATKNALLARTSTPSKTTAVTTSVPTELDSKAAVAALLLAEILSVTKQIPNVATNDLGSGAEGAEVSLVQTYLILNASGDAHTKLKLAGATGYFGPVTEAALREFQASKGIAPTGMYDSSTRAAMLL
jgi:peptidoglycan hydrolase-like protein with peptidoglycan-binding domain